MVLSSRLLAVPSRLFLVLSVLLASPVLFSQVSGLSAHDQRELTSALAADNAGHPQQAEQPLRDLVHRYPRNFEILESLGLVYAELGEYAQACPYLTTATQVNSSSAVAFANLGSAYLKLGRTSDAIKALQRAADIDPKNAETQSALGLARMQTRQPKLAAEAFARAANVGPPGADLLYNWSVALLGAGEITDASAVASRIPDSASSAQVQSLLGDIAEHQDQFKIAVERYQKAMDLSPTEANIYTLAMEFVRHWTFDPAIKIFDYGLERYPASTLLLSGKGIAEYADNHYADAASIFSGLLAHDSNNALYAEILGHSCNLMPDSTAGCNSMIAFAEAHPSNASASLFAAKSLLHNPGDPDATAKAEVLLRRATAIDPKLADAWYELGLLDQQKGNWRQSQTALEKCVALQPKLSKAHYRLALAYAHLGRRDEAKREIALQQQYSEQEKDKLNARMQDVTRFVVENH